MCKKLVFVYRDKSQMDKFNDMFNMSETIEEFKRNWDNRTRDNGIQDNRWLKSINVLITLQVLVPCVHSQ